MSRVYIRKLYTYLKPKFLNLDDTNIFSVYNALLLASLHQSENWSREYNGFLSKKLYKLNSTVPVYTFTGDPCLIQTGISSN